MLGNHSCDTGALVSAATGEAWPDEGFIHKGVETNHRTALVHMVLIYPQNFLIGQ